VTLFDTTRLTALELNCLFPNTFKNGENTSKIYFLYRTVSGEKVPVSKHKSEHIYVEEDAWDVHGGI
jgi:hypothetical protein